ncbi:MAG TPA: shikimate dehydrogenase [Bacteroidia bacterium]|jgi:shikimate dehydrogenase|nr:shikimate dehydrogenase [Bacteroidia bacterium]
MQFGLIGKSLSHSFSKKYFEEKFKKENLINFSFTNFELNSISEFENIIKQNPQLKGVSVTVPYKEQIIPFINELSSEAKEIGAVNCINFVNGKSIGYNTDVFGFKTSIKPFLEPKHNRALIFGTGGSSKAIAYALKQIGVDYFFVTSSQIKKNTNAFFYSELSEIILSQFLLLINCTPVGMFPDINKTSNIPFDFVTEDHLAYDLIYNPTETVFLKNCKEKGAITINGYSMLQLQAEKAWEIWNQKN